MRFSTSTADTLPHNSILVTLSGIFYRDEYGLIPKILDLLLHFAIALTPP
ncbi:hypothetical protein [Fischerella sp. PCC 9605]|nr:hypothetical protein [Fischerella sp. PCC 9605]